MTISSANEFRAFVMRLIDEQKAKYKGTLEEYLRSIWASILNHRDETPSYGLFGDVVQEAFLITPARFEDDWMRYDAPPSKLSLLMVSGGSSSSKNREADFDRLRSEILFLIAELNRMKPHSKDEWRYLGIQSPTGHSWYNWDTFGYLECATAGLISQIEQGRLADTNSSRCNWSLLAFILELGAIYE